MKNIAVIGAGTMGNGIAHTFAQKGFQVNLIDISDKALEKGIGTITTNLDRMVAKGTITDSDKQHTLNNITSFTDMKQGVSGVALVVEAATENIDLKLNIFRQLNDFCSEYAISSTHTSSLSIAPNAALANAPLLVIGTHFMNPAPIMNLVEIAPTYITSVEVTKAIMDLSLAL